MKKYLDKNKLKEHISLIIGIITIFLLLIGASFAYFQAQIKDGGKTNIDVKSGTTDNLTFSISDIDVSDANVKDEHNPTEDSNNTEIVINASQFNFGQNDKSLGDGVKVSANLLANDDTNKAEAKYNLFVIIEKNDFEYTTETEEPEIILSVTDPLGRPVDNIKELKKVEGGYDITKRSGTFLITSDYDIKADPNTTQDWQVKVTLVNLPTNQHQNAGKSLSGRVYITDEKLPSYKLPEVNNSSVEKTYNTVLFTPMVNEGTESIVKYYYGIEEKKTNGIALMSAETVKYEETTKPSYTFEGLKANTTYTIYSYVENKSKMKSNVYETEVTTNEYKEPIINKVTFESELYTIKAIVDAKGQDGKIETYHYYKDGELIASIPEAEYTYEGLSDTSSYDLKIEVEDNNHAKSTAYEERVSTKEYIYPEIENVDVTDQKWNSVTLTTNVKKSTNDVTEYQYQVEKKDGTVVQEWFVGTKTQVIENLEANQEYNVKIKVKDSIGRESKKEYEQAISTSEYNYIQIKVSPTITTDSIKLDVSATPGDGTITKYMYSKNGGDSWEEFSSTELTHSYTFGNLTSDTEFPIWVKVIDSNNKESNIYKETITTSYIEPTAQSVVLSEINGANITATINVTKGSREFQTYYFKINDGESYNSSISNSYSFEIAKTGNIKVEAYAIDSKGHTTNHVTTSYINAKANKIEVTEIPSENSITVTTTASKGTGNIKTYYFRIDEEAWQKIESSETSASITIENINKNDAFNISSYVEDINNRNSNEVLTGVKQVTVLFNGNGNSVEAEKKSCFITSGEESCKITTPGITAHSNTPTVIGYSLSGEDHSKVIGANEELTLKAENNGKTYYAQTTAPIIIHNITYTKQGNGVTAIGKESDTCSRIATYNGEAQAKNCTVVAPSITVSTGYTSVGWSTTATSHEGTKVDANITLTGDANYYSISYKNPITYNVTYDKNNNTIAATSGSCTIPAAYNTDTQATTCTTTTPVISVNTTTPTILGYAQSATATTAEVESEKELTLSATNNGKTYYAITRKDAVTYNVIYDKNNNTIAATSGSCTIAATYNGVSQGTTCTTKTPKITAPEATPTILGYAQSASATTAEVGSEKDLTLSATNNGKTYYAITTAPVIIHKITYTKQGNGVTAIGKESDSCTRAATYNGVAQASSCTVVAPSITVDTGYTAVGWSATATSHEGTAATQNITLTGDATYYSISYKNPITYNVTYNANNNTIAATSGSCTIPAAYNTDTQATTCTTTTPVISKNDKTPTILGYAQTATATAAEVGSGASLTLSAANTGKTYYAITTAPAITYNVTYDKNNNTIAATSGSCTIAATYNGTSQGTSCTTKTPKITAPGNTPTILGYAQSASATSAEVGSEKDLTLTSTNNKKTYYAITTAPAITHTITYTKQGGGVTAIGKGSDTCTRVATFNGTAQAANCTVVAPSISVGTGYTAVGWSTTATAHEGIAANQNITLTGNATYYSISYKNPITYNVTYNANNNTIAATSGSCTIPAAYNTDTQATTCTTTTPVISKNDKTPTILGYAQTATATAAEVGSGASLTLSATNTGKTYYAITRKDAVTRSITYNKGTNVSATGKGTDSCTIAATYNGTSQGTTCNITLTTITPASGYLVDGFYDGTTRKGNVGASIAIGGNVTYTANVGTVTFALNNASASQMKVTATVSPASTPLTGYQYSTDNSNWTTSSTTNTNTFSVNATSSYTLYVKVTDKQNNAVTKSVGYTNPSIGTPIISNPKWNSLDVSVTATQGTANIANYYFSSNDGTSYGSPVANTTMTGTTTLTGLEPSKTYNIKAYVEDANGRRSAPSTTGTGTTAAYTYPTVKITSTSSTSTTITINATATNGTGTIKAYRYFLENTQKIEKTSTLLTDSYTIDSGITPGETYTVKVQVVDSNDKVSTFTTDNQKDVKILDKIVVDLLADANKNGVTTLYHHNAKDLTDPDMANSDKIAGDDSYRFSGSDTDVKNYVCLDSKTTGDCENDDDLYRIIGLFKNNQDEYEMKLIKAQGATTTQLGDSAPTTGGGAYDGLYSSSYRSFKSSYKGSNWETLATYNWNKSNGTTSGNVNMWAESNLNKVNLNQFYYNYITTRATYLQNHITEHTWTTGGMAITGDAKTTYDLELGEGKVKAGDSVCYTQGNTSTTRACIAEDLEYKAHIGLFYISDYMYGARPSSWLTLASSYNSVTRYNWLYSGMNEWTISRYSSFGSFARFVNYTGNASNGTVDISGYAVRPSFYLTSNARISEGEGSKTKPYRLSWIPDNIG